MQTNESPRKAQPGDRAHQPADVKPRRTQYRAQLILVGALSAVTGQPRHLDAYSDASSAVDLVDGIAAVPDRRDRFVQSP